jgi:putative resolvase
VKLAEWTRVDRVHPQAAYRWFRRDRMPVPARLLAPGTIWVDAAPTGESGRVVVDARRGARNRAIRAITAARRGDEDGAA